MNGSGVPGESPLYVEFKGAMAENMVLQSLVTQYDVMPRYWASEGTAEVDFLLQTGASVLPIEVKSGIRLSGKSLGLYIKKYAPELAIRYSMNNLKKRRSGPEHSSFPRRLDR